jgi:hypothetical protein
MQEISIISQISTLTQLRDSLLSNLMNIVVSEDNADMSDNCAIVSKVGTVHRK